MSLQLQNVSKFYGNQKALDAITFSVSKGEIVGLLGPNGSGKSTLMKIITSFIQPDSGNIEICGIDIQKNSIASRAKIGYLPEHNPLYPEMYVWEYLEFIAGIQLPRKLRKDRIKKMIELTGLIEEQFKKIDQLSKGYRQRVGIAQALMNDPEVLILDEPTTGLDPNQLQEVRALIKEVGENKTVILSTHIMQEVEALCDRTIILKDGKIVADQKTSELKNKSADVYSVVVEFDAAVKKESLLQLENVSNVKFVKDKWVIETSVKEDIRPLIFQFAVEQGMHVLSMNKLEKSLENVFQELTKK